MLYENQIIFFKKEKKTDFFLKFFMHPFLSIIACVHIICLFSC